jgi:hypothetical protein
MPWLHSCEVAKMTGPKKKVVSNFEIGIVVVLNLPLSRARVMYKKNSSCLNYFLSLFLNSSLVVSEYTNCLFVVNVAK